jgi:hypothetical protein
MGTLKSKLSRVKSAYMGTLKSKTLEATFSILSRLELDRSTQNNTRP